MARKDRTDPRGDKTLFDKILEYMTQNHEKDGITLSDEDARLLERYDFIDNLLRKHRPNLSMKEIGRMVKMKFGTSERQFYYDLHQTQKLYASLDSGNKDYKKMVYVEWLKQAASLAEIRGDFKAVEKCLRTAAELEGLFEKDELMPEDETPRAFIMAVQMTLNGDAVSSKNYDLNKLHLLPPSELRLLIDTVDQPPIGVKQMEKLLQEYTEFEEKDEN